MQDDGRNRRLREMVAALEELVELADREQDFVLAAKSEDVRLHLIGAIARAEGDLHR